MLSADIDIPKNSHNQKRTFQKKNAAGGHAPKQGSQCIIAHAAQRDQLPH
jgi:hypothetical protein